MGFIRIQDYNLLSCAAVCVLKPKKLIIILLIPHFEVIINNNNLSENSFNREFNSFTKVKISFLFLVNLKMVLSF